MPTKYSLQHGQLPSVTEKDKKARAEAEDVELEVAESVIFHEKPYAGMSPEDVDRFSNTPFWNNFRRIALAIFFLLWFSLFLISIILIVIYPRCGPTPIQKWWQHSSFYQIYVPSFQDSNDDGIGDIRGLESRLGELQYMGVDTLVLSPIFRQEGVPIGRFSEDLVTDFESIDRRMGNESDLRLLVTSAKDKGMRLILEFPVNHVGSNHTWFQNSLKGFENASNFFIWSSACSPGMPPNNWQSRSGGSAWEYVIRKKACYYHSGGRDQPDLNWRSAVVSELMRKALKSWLARGFDGVLLTRATDLVEDYDLRHEESITSHNYTRDLPETVDVIKRLRIAVHDHNDSAVLMVGLDSNLDALDRYVSLGGAVVADVAINRRPLSVLEDPKCRAECLWNVIHEVDTIVQRPQWPAFLLDDRHAESRLNIFLKSPNAAMLLFSILPGSFLSYYGDEVGLNHTLSPMRWSNSTNGDFTDSSSTPWLSVERNIQNNFMTGKNRMNSGVQLLKTVQKIRKANGALQYGRLHLVVAKDPILAVRREFDGVSSFLVCVNFGNRDIEAAEMNLSGQPEIPSEMDLVVDTLSGVSKDGSQPKIKSASVALKAGQGLLFRWDYIIKEHL